METRATGAVSAGVAKARQALARECIHWHALL